MPIQDFSKVHLAVITIAVSSAYMLTQPVLMSCSRSLAYNEKSQGPGTEPWGTPKFTALGSDGTPYILKLFFCKMKEKLSICTTAHECTFCKVLIRRYALKAIDRSKKKLGTTPLFNRKLLNDS